MALELDTENKALQAGTPYHVRIERTETRRSNAGGLLLEVKFTLLGEGFDGNELPTQYFNIVNQNGRAEAISAKRMRELCKAAGREMPRSKNDLLGAECLITLDDNVRIIRFAPVPKKEVGTVDTVGEAENDSVTHRNKA